MSSASLPVHTRAQSFRRVIAMIGMSVAAASAVAAAPTVAGANPLGVAAHAGHTAHVNGRPAVAKKRHKSTTSRHTSKSTSAKATHHRMSFTAKFDTRSSKVIAEVKKQLGKPYVYGAAGPHAFDCSGLVMYVFAHSLHMALPHNAAEQYRVSRHISRKRARPGDLVFVDEHGYIPHVGIYAGHGYFWNAPHTGTRVQRQKMDYAHFVFGRVIHIPSH